MGLIAVHLDDRNIGTGDGLGYAFSIRVSVNSSIVQHKRDLFPRPETRIYNWPELRLSRVLNGCRHVGEVKA
jgi:hypothetical protein